MKKMKQPVLIVAIVLVFALGGLFWQTSHSGEGEAELGPSTHSTQSPAQEPPALVPASVTKGTESESPSRREELAAAAPEDKPSAPAVEQDRRAEVRGQFLLPGGAPAVGAQIRMMGWEANSARVRKHGQPTDYENPTATTDVEGRFSIRFDPPQAYQFVLNASLAGFSTESWRWLGIELGELVDVGSVVFRRAGTIVGRMVNARGEPVHEDWTLYAEAVQQSGMEGKDMTRVSTKLERSTGHFRLEGLPPGPTRITAYSRIANWIDGPLVEVIAGEEVEAEVVYSGPDNSRRIVVVTFSRPFYTIQVEAESIYLSSATTQVRDAVKIEGSSQSYAFDEVDPGSYSIGIDSPLFQPWSEGGVEPGTRTNARLKGNAAVRLEVLDGRTGEAIEAYVLDVRFDDSNTRPNIFRIHESGQEVPTGGLYDGLVPLPQTLLVEAEGYAMCELALPDLQPFETRVLRAELQIGTRLAGTVRESDRSTPVPGARVWLLPLGESPRGPWLGEGETFQLEATCDAKGRFELLGAPTGSFSLMAQANDWMSVRIEDLQVSAGEERSDLELILPPCASLRGRLLAPDGADFSGLQLFVRPSVEPGAGSSRLHSKGLPVVLASNGTFTAGPLPPGEVALILSGPKVMVPSSFDFNWAARVPTLEFARLELVLGNHEEHEFDLRETWPGAIRIEVRREGQLAPGYIVEVLGPNARNAGSSAAVTGVDGVATIRHLFPGEYAVLARPIEGAWQVQSPETLFVASGETAQGSIEIGLISGVLTVLDEVSGTPLAKQDLRLVQTDSGKSHVETTDALGRLELELSPGFYRVGRTTEPGSQNKPQAPFEWTAAGPLPAQVRLPVESE